MSQTLTSKLLRMYQSGGSIIDPHPRYVMRRDNEPRPKIIFKPELAQTDLHGNVLPAPRDQGTINVPYKRSVRESMLHGLSSIDRDGDNMVAGIVTEPLKAGLRLLRPDKYFSDVHSDSDIGGALGKLALDGSQVVPIVAEGRSLFKVPGPTVDAAGRIVHTLNAETSLVDKAKDKLGDAVSGALNRKFIPVGNKQVLPNNITLKPFNETRFFRGVQAVGDDGKPYGIIKTVDPMRSGDNWSKVNSINVHPALQGNKFQDVLYQSAIDQAKELGAKGIRSGDHLLSPGATVKAHGRFNREVLDMAETDGIEHGIVGMTGHENPNIITDWMSKYKDIPKSQPQTYSINDLFRSAFKGPPIQQELQLR